jgi:glucose/arabinose dehydrogenase
MRHHHLAYAALALALVLSVAGGAAAVGPAATVPADFADALVTNVPAPTALAFTPDGRMLITSQSGQLRVYQDGALLATPALDLAAADRICSDFERGLLGVAVDPAFATNRSVYLYYTFKKHGGCAKNTADSPVNRVSRFVLPDNNVINLAGEVVLVDNMPSPNGNHNAGDLHFGKDGYLYISIGDGGCDYADDSGCGGSNDAARDQHVLTGKILRVTRDGGIPPGNPFTDADSAACGQTGSTDPSKKCRETFASGLRNPYRIAFDPNASGTRFFINDVGQDTWEEIDEASAGADYGWNVREGRCARGSTTNCGAPPAGMTNPIYAYGRGTGCNSITGGAFVPNGVWPAPYSGAYLFGDYGCPKIFRLVPSGGGNYTAEEFATQTGSIVHMAFGPYGATQALYYTSYSGGGQVRRIVHTASANQAPSAVLAANPPYGKPAPLTVTLSAAGSADPDDGDTLTYLWNFGDQSAPSETSNPQTTHVYAAGTYTATLRVRDNHGATSAPATVRIDSGNTPPEAAIDAPAANKRFRVGETIVLNGSGNDEEDGGALPDGRLSWRVILHHAAHTHPFLGPVAGNNISFVAPRPEDLAAAANSYLEIELTATDSTGLTEVITQELRPNQVSLTLATQPSGLLLILEGTPITTPRTVTSWEGYVLAASAPIQGAGGEWFRLDQWSDGNANSVRTITTPATAATYTATFTTTEAMLLPAVAR